MAEENAPAPAGPAVQQPAAVPAPAAPPATPQPAPAAPAAGSTLAPPKPVAPQAAPKPQAAMPSRPLELPQAPILPSPKFAKKQPKQEKPAKINAAKYIAEASKLGTHSHSQCGYCGSSNIAAGDVWVCHRCENAVSTAMNASKLNDPQLVDSLKLVNDYERAEDFVRADAEFAKILTTHNDPAFVYRYAIFNLEYSNSEVRAIRYDRPGFMEENAKHREFASKLDSKAKELFIKAIWMCQKELDSGAGDAFLVHVMFMSYIKMKNAKSAKKAIERNVKYNNQYLVQYENMVLNAELGKPHETVAYADELTGKTGVSANAFYYITWALFKLKMTGQATKLLAQVSLVMENDSVAALSKGIKISREM